MNYRGKRLPLDFNTAVVTSFRSHFHSKSDCHGIFITEESGTSKSVISRTGRGIYKQSMIFIFFSSAHSSQTNLLFE